MTVALLDERSSLQCLGSSTRDAPNLLQRLLKPRLATWGLGVGCSGQFPHSVALVIDAAHEPLVASGLFIQKDTKGLVACLDEVSGLTDEDYCGAFL